MRINPLVSTMLVSSAMVGLLILQASMTGRLLEQRVAGSSRSAAAVAASRAMASGAPADTVVQTATGALHVQVAQVIRADGAALRVVTVTDAWGAELRRLESVVGGVR